MLGAVGVWSEWRFVYQGGSSDCVWLRQDMGLDDVVKVVEGTIQEGLQRRSLWYSTKYDQKMQLPLQTIVDAGKLVKVNDEFGYMYITERNVPISKLKEGSQVGKMCRVVLVRVNKVEVVTKK